MKVNYFDIHVVADELPTGLENTLLRMGFNPKDVVGGDVRVRMRHLLSLKVADHKTAHNVFTESVSVIKEYPSFNGYIESEAVTEDLTINVPCEWSQCGDFPLRLNVSPCPPGKFKRCDIHVAIPAGDERVTTKLREAGFYYLSLYKPGGGSFNVVTIQFENVKRGRRLWDELLIYLRQCSGFNGFAKFEVTMGIKNFGFHLPPMVLADDFIVSLDCRVAQSDFLQL